MKKNIVVILGCLCFVGGGIHTSQASDDAANNMLVMPERTFLSCMLHESSDKYQELLQEFAPSIEMLSQTLDAAIEQECTSCSDFLSSLIAEYYNQTFKNDYSRLNDLWSHFYQNPEIILTYIEKKKDNLLYRIEGKRILLEIGITLQNYSLMEQVLSDSNIILTKDVLGEIVDLSCSHYNDLNGLTILLSAICPMYNLPLPSQTGVDYLLYNFIKNDFQNGTLTCIEEFVDFIQHANIVQPSSQGLKTSILSCLYVENALYEDHLVLIFRRLLSFCDVNKLTQFTQPDLNQLYTKSLQIHFVKMMDMLREMSGSIRPDIEAAIMAAYDTRLQDGRLYVASQFYLSYGDVVCEMSDDMLTVAYNGILESAVRLEFLRGMLCNSLDLDSLRAQFIMEMDRRLVELQNVEYQETMERDVLQLRETNIAVQENQGPPIISPVTPQLSRADMRAARAQFFNQRNGG